MFNNLRKKEQIYEPKSWNIKNLVLELPIGGYLSRFTENPMYVLKIGVDMLNEFEYTIRIPTSFYKKILDSELSLNDINIESLKNGFVAIKNIENKIVDCSMENTKCNSECVLYNKCDYCIMKQFE